MACFVGKILLNADGVYKIKKSSKKFDKLKKFQFLHLFVIVCTYNTLIFLVYQIFYSIFFILYTPLAFNKILFVDKEFILRANNLTQITFYSNQDFTYVNV